MKNNGDVLLNELPNQSIQPIALRLLMFSLKENNEN